MESTSGRVSGSAASGSAGDSAAGVSGASGLAVPLEACLRASALGNALDRGLRALHERGAAGDYAPVSEGEVARTLAALALDAGDWLFTDGGSLAPLLARGATAAELAHHALGDANDTTRGHASPGHAALRRARIFTSGTRNGAHLTQAAGLAWAAKIKKDAVVALCLFDGAAVDAAELHHGVNFAGAFGVPVVFVCVTREAVGATERGVAYGVASASCEAGDAVHSLVRAAVDRARQGGGPSFVEVRLGDESVLDDAMRARAESAGVDVEAIDAWATREAASACAAAEKTAAPARASLFDAVYASPPWHLQEQRDRGGAA